MTLRGEWRYTPGVAVYHELRIIVGLEGVRLQTKCGIVGWRSSQAAVDTLPACKRCWPRDGFEVHQPPELPSIPPPGVIGIPAPHA